MTHRVALVEDDPEVRDLIELLLDLDDRFVHVGSAVEGHAGLRLVAEAQPDAVILDLDLPDGPSGLDVIGLMAQRSPHTRIVVFSAFADPMTLIDVLRLGADAYLDKGSAWSELLPTVAGLCARSTSPG